MKINWGTGIVIAFVLFIGFILTLIVTMTTDKSLNHDLVVEDYYNKATHYQKEIDAEENALALSDKLVFKKTNEGYVVLFPKTQDFSKINGIISFNRPNNKNLDFEMPIKLSNNHFLIPDDKLLKGRWKVTIFWTYEGIDYMYKDKTTY